MRSCYSHFVTLPSLWWRGHCDCPLLSDSHLPALAPLGIELKPHGLPAGPWRWQAHSWLSDLSGVLCQDHSWLSNLSGSVLLSPWNVLPGHAPPHQGQFPSFLPICTLRSSLAALLKLHLITLLATNTYIHLIFPFLFVFIQVLISLKYSVLLIFLTIICLSLDSKFHEDRYMVSF